MFSHTKSFPERATLCTSPVAKTLFRLLGEKMTNLAFSADVTSAAQLLFYAELLGPEIAIFKTHIDIIDDFTPALTIELRRLAKQYEFLLFEDRKFADIGNTVKHQYAHGVYHISSWAHLINAHSIAGAGIVQGLLSAKPESAGLLLIAEMSCAGHLMDNHYAKKTMELAEAYPEFVIGFITQHAFPNQPQWIYMTPGVQISEGSDSLGQQYITPEQAISENGTDIIIVGRGILQAADALSAAKQYRQRGWQAVSRNRTVAMR